MKFLIIGCGRVGVALAHTLSDRGHTITLIDKNPSATTALGAGFRGHTVVGSALDRGMLLGAGIEQSDGLAAVTGSDETNVVTAQLARRLFHVPKVIARVYDPRKAEIYQRLGIQILNPVTWGSNRIAELLSFSPLDAIVSLGTGDVDIVEADVPQLWVGRTVADATMATEVHIVALTREGRTFLPSANTVFHAGDLVHVAVHATAADRLKGLLGAA